MDEQGAIRPGSQEPVTIKAFREALTIFSGISEGTIKTMTNPEDQSITIGDEDDDDSPVQITFTDNTLNRFGSLMAQKYSGRENEFASLMMRIFALMNALQSADVCSEFMEDDGAGNHVGVHPALVDVAATFPMLPEGGFEIDSYLEAVRNLAREEYPDIT